MFFEIPFQNQKAGEHLLFDLLFDFVSSKKRTKYLVCKVKYMLSHAKLTGSWILVGESSAWESKKKKQCLVLFCFLSPQKRKIRRPNTECFRSLNSIRVPLLSRVQVLWKISFCYGLRMKTLISLQFLYSHKQRTRLSGRKSFVRRRYLKGTFDQDRSLRTSTTMHQACFRRIQCQMPVLISPLLANSAFVCKLRHQRDWWHIS